MKRMWIDAILVFVGFAFFGAIGLSIGNPITGAACFVLGGFLLGLMAAPKETSVYQYY